VAARRTELVDLPVSFERPVRLFTYILGHSQVLFRGEQDIENGVPTTIEILFTDVSELSVRDGYRCLTVRLPSPAEDERLRVACGRPWQERRAFILESESGGDGHVVAGGMYWAEISSPASYSSFLIPNYDLPRLRPEQPSPSEPITVFAPFPRH
jgi:hypothetical protein